MLARLLGQLLLLGIFHRAVRWRAVKVQHSPSLQKVIHKLVSFFIREVNADTCMKLVSPFDMVDCHGFEA